MRSPEFWWNHNPNLAAWALRPVGAVFGALVMRRMRRLDGYDCGAPVICVGNFVAGGAGKTPLALALAELLKLRGERPAFLSRGYGGRNGGSPIRVELGKHGARLVGDEPLLLARVAPTFVCADRRASAKAAVAAGATAVIMDDGLQNPSLKKKLTFGVIDAETGVGNQLCIPAGPLRAPFQQQLYQVDVVVVLGDRQAQAGREAAKKSIEMGKPTLFASLKPDPEIAAKLSGRHVLAFAGIGRPGKFFRTLVDLGAKILATRDYSDHHVFTDQELRQLAEESRELDAMLVTTEKDLMRLNGDPELAALAEHANALPVRLVVEEQDQFRALVLGALKRN